jgi:hypothetical protein
MNRLHKPRGTVRVHTTDERTIQGVVVSQRGEYIVLGAAQIVNRQAAATDLSGTVYVPKSRVLFVQAVPA